MEIENKKEIEGKREKMIDMARIRGMQGERESERVRENDRWRKIIEKRAIKSFLEAGGLRERWVKTYWDERKKTGSIFRVRMGKNN